MRDRRARQDSSASTRSSCASRTPPRKARKAAYGPKFGPIGLIETLEAVKSSEHYKAPLGPNQGRGVASGFWFNIGGETSAAINVNEDGTVTLMAGTPDIGGSRASSALMAAEVLCIPYDKVRPIIADTSSLGFTFLTGGSRATFSNGIAVREAAQQVVKEMCARAAKIWEIPVDAVTWEDGVAKPAGAERRRLRAAVVRRARATWRARPAGRSRGHAHLNAQGAGPSFGTHLVDVEVDKETGRVTILRYTVVQDAGKAVHPSYVEGQYQGGAVQGIGWALNEEYIYGPDGRLQNPGFLDYRMPVASDVPMIDTVIVEVPNPRHPFGVRGVGETPIVPPMAAIANAIEQATGIRFTALPMSPPRVLKALDEANGAGVRSRERGDERGQAGEALAGRRRGPRRHGGSAGRRDRSSRHRPGQPRFPARRDQLRTDSCAPI